MVGKDVDDKNLNYRLVWIGSDHELDFDYTADEKALESVFDYFNRQKPENFLNRAFRSLLIGDVVCLEDRCYLCQRRAGGNSKTLKREAVRQKMKLEKRGKIAISKTQYLVFCLGILKSLKSHDSERQ